MEVYEAKQLALRTPQGAKEKNTCSKKNKEVRKEACTTDYRMGYRNTYGKF